MRLIDDQPHRARLVWHSGLVRLIIVEDEPLLRGSGADLGQIRRRGQIVVRPAGPHSATVQAFLTHLAMVGFGGSPRPVGQSESDEMLEYIRGDVRFPRGLLMTDG